MASGKGLSKKHSALQKAHYLAYRSTNQARKNLIKRLRRVVKDNLKQAAKRVRYNERIISARKKGVAKRVPMKSIAINKQAVNRLKALGG